MLITEMTSVAGIFGSFGLILFIISLIAITLFRPIPIWVKGINRLGIFLSVGSLVFLATMVVTTTIATIITQTKGLEWMAPGFLVLSLLSLFVAGPVTYWLGTKIRPTFWLPLERWLGGADDCVV